MQGRVDGSFNPFCAAGLGGRRTGLGGGWSQCSLGGRRTSLGGGWSQWQRMSRDDLDGRFSKVLHNFLKQQQPFARLIIEGFKWQRQVVLPVEHVFTDAL